MPKKKPVPNGKRSRPAKKRPSKNPDPEWAFVEERFSGMDVDFHKLAAMMEPEQDSNQQ
ncbi:MAG: hypothetical protein ABII00_12615 [Elusimicrobiota bacterium]